MDEYLLAVIADQHGVKEALDVIIEDISLAEKRLRKLGYSTPIKKGCIGDTLGYGPEQLECLTIVKDFYINLPGNHEFMVLDRLIKPNIPLVGASSTAVNSTNITVNELIGEKRINYLGKTIYIPQERIEDLLENNYVRIIAQEITRRNISKAKLPPQKIGRFKGQVPHETQERIGEEYITQMLMLSSGMSSEYDYRIKRRNAVLGIYSFLEKICKKPEFRLKNAIFVHDNPIHAGDGRYLVGPRKAKQMSALSGKPVKNRINIRELDPRRFPGIEYIFVGHVHASAGIEEVNGIKIVYCGGAIPRDTFERKTSYMMIGIRNQRVVSIFEPRILDYNWQTTQRKLREKEMPPIFGKK